MTEDRVPTLPHCPLCGADPVDALHALEIQRRWKALSEQPAPLDVGYHRRRVAKEMKDDEYRDEYERVRDPTLEAMGQSGEFAAAPPWAFEDPEQPASPLDVERLAEAILRHDADDTWPSGSQVAHDRGRCGNNRCASTIATEYDRLGSAPSRSEPKLPWLDTLRRTAEND